MSRNAYIHTGRRSRVGGREIEGQRRLKLNPVKDVDFEAVDAMEVLVLQGRDIGEPVVQHGPFVGNSREDISKAFRDYQASWGGGAMSYHVENMAISGEAQAFRGLRRRALAVGPGPRTPWRTTALSRASRASAAVSSRSDPCPPEAAFFSPSEAPPAWKWA